MTTQPPGEPGPPPPPPGAPVGARGPLGPGGPGARPLPPAGPNPWLMLLVGLIIGLLIGGGLGYLLFHGTKTSAPLTTPSASASASASATATTAPSATAPATSPSASAAASGVVPCPVAVPAGQHALGSPGPPGSGTHADPTLDFCGQGNATIPPGTTAFTTNSNWGIGYATSCPAGTAPGGMGTAVTVSEQISGGGAGPDAPVEIPGDWSSDGGSSLASGGNYQLQVTTVSPNCVWHIAIYPS